MRQIPQATTVINNFTDYDMYVDFLAKSGHADGLPFVEFLWDGFAHLDPAFVRDSLGPLGRQVAFHVMWSGFVDLDDEAFMGYLKLLRSHVAEMKPLYVSEHCCSLQEGNINLREATELDWEPNIDRLCDRISRYQDYLGVQLLMENFGSIHEGGSHQVEHVATLTQRTGCGVLFDVSNAVLAELNGVAKFDNWLELLRGSRNVRAHVGGYSRDEELQVYEDSHAFALSAATQAALERTLRTLDIASVCYERAYNLDTDEMSRELRGVEATIKEVFNAHTN